MRPPAPRPCTSCPYRTDVPSGIWAPEEYETLLDYDRPTQEQPYGLFSCHQNDSASAAVRVCAGWVACHGSDLIGLRIAVLSGALTAAEVQECFKYETDIRVFATAQEAYAHGIRDIQSPTPEAQEMMHKILRQRTDIVTGHGHEDDWDQDYWDDK